jgi:hypothetical protein
VDGSGSRGDIEEVDPQSSSFVHGSDHILFFDVAINVAQRRTTEAEIRNLQACGAQLPTLQSCHFA